MDAPETSPPGPHAVRPDALDTTRPDVAGVYDYLLGGKTNSSADRHLAEQLLTIYPGIRQMVRVISSLS
jgi:hypothetical protein